MRTAVVVVDMLNDFIRPEGVLYCGPQSEAIIRPIAERIAEARASGEPVIYVCDRHRPDDAEFQMFPPHAVGGTPGAEIIAELAPDPEDHVVPKRRYSAFAGTDLLLTLRELQVEGVELVGVCTNICVLYTACDARNLGYLVTVHAARVASFDRTAHEFALQQMETVLGVEVLRPEAEASAGAQAQGEGAGC